MAITVDMFKVRFPEFTPVPDSRVELSILEATILMGDDVERWLGQEMYYLANSYLIAHLLTISQGQSMGDSSASNPLRETAVDNVEVSYAVANAPSFLDSEFASTSYGSRYIMYRNMCFTGGYAI